MKSLEIFILFRMIKLTFKNINKNKIILKRFD